MLVVGDYRQVGSKKKRVVSQQLAIGNVKWAISKDQVSKKS